MESRTEFRSVLARASAALIASLALVAACVGDDPDTNDNASSSSGGSSGASSSGASGASSSGTSSGDASADDAGTKKCDALAAFGATGDVPGLGSVQGKAARLTPDEKTLYFHVVAPARLKVTSRSSTSMGFDPPSNVLGIAPTPDASDAPYEDAFPAIGQSDKNLFFESSRDQSTVDIKRIYTASRGAVGTASQFDAPSIVDGLPNPSFGPYVIGDGGVIYGHHPVGGVNVVFRAKQNGATYQFDDIDLGGGAEFPVVSSDEHVMYFASSRGGSSGVRIWVSVRTGPTTNEPFGPPQLVGNVNADSELNVPSWLSADYCRLYFFRGVAQKLLLAQRSP